jgi:hypothetical protein
METLFSMAQESVHGRGCVKTSIESQFVPRLRNFRNLQFAKALISLKLKFQWPGQVHNSSSSPTFLHSLGHNRTFGSHGLGRKRREWWLPKKTKSTLQERNVTTSQALGPVEIQDSQIS